ncbi:hypothetical protein [Streptomyces adustus]|uniref:hypothetical protein n=1 Tax=Streptomyces adustus TaxID=1609272 RepID=UPI0037178296
MSFTVRNASVVIAAVALLLAAAAAAVLPSITHSGPAAIPTAHNFMGGSITAGTPA